MFAIFFLLKFIWQCIAEGSGNWKHNQYFPVVKGSWKNLHFLLLYLIDIIMLGTQIAICTLLLV